MSELINKSISVLKNEGVIGLKNHVSHYIKKKQDAKPKSDVMKDVLFINGCPRDLLPHPPRYRVSHQMEQLILNGYTCDEVYYENVDLKQVKMYNAFIIFRAPFTTKLETFIQLAKTWNKTVFYDIDDLVIDTEYTNQISYIQNMDSYSKKKYDMGVMNNQRLLKLCDGCITTTAALKDELSKYNSNVMINRNTASIEMVKLSQNVEKTDSQFINIGYFSGSITHNADFEMIKPVLKEIMELYPNIKLHVVGELDRPTELNVEVHPFMDYKKLPALIGQMDINLAPLENSIFNASKSEIKWIEASLVKTCTIASNIGAFKEMIQDHITGLLCETLEDWKSNLIDLIENKNTRDYLANNAYEFCFKNCTTMYTGYRLVSILKSFLKPNIAFCFAKLEISGGVMVALRHALFLQEDGYDVCLLSYYDSIEEYKFMDHTFPVLPLKNEKIYAHIDMGVATMWPTVKMLDDIKFIHNKKYLVQGFETDFYPFGDTLKISANQSYSYPFEYITISKWCEEWLKNSYGQIAKWIPNGIDLIQYKSHKRKLLNKIKILIEGDCSSPHKNVDEAFMITNTLDSNQYEVWYMSYNAKPKDNYRIDRFLHRIPYDKVQEVYENCDILIKTSLSESFSYPPLEMMATGGFVVALQNDGNKEYLINEVNCLIYQKGNIDEGIKCIKRIVSDENLQERLYKNGLETAKQRDWNLIKEKIKEVYK